QLAVFDSGETIGGAVEAEDLYFLASAGAQGFNRTKRHLIIFCEDCLDIRICLQQVSGDIQAFSAVKVRGLLGYNLNIWICSDAFFKALAAVAGCGRTSDALQNQDFAFLADGLGKCIGSLLAAGDVVGSHETCYFTGIGGAVYCDNWNISVVQRLHGRAHGIRVSGVDDDHIGTGGLSIAQLIRLGSGVIGSVLDIQVDAEFVCLRLRTIAQFDEEWVGLRGQRQRDRAAVRSVGAFPAVTCNSGDRQGCDGSDGQGLTGSGGKSKHVNDSFEVGGRKKAWVDSALLRSFVTDDVEANGQCDDQTDDDLLPKRGHVEQVQAIADHRQQQRTDERSGCAAL